MPGWERMKQAFGRWWRKYIVDECPDSRIERIREERMAKLRIHTDLLEAIRLQDENRKGRALEIERN